MRTQKGGQGEASARYKVAAKYHEVALLADSEQGAAMNNVVVGIAILAGIAAADVICLRSLGKRYAGTDHAEAARLLQQTNPEQAKHLTTLIRFKPTSHYGHSFISEADRITALRAAAALLIAARALL